MGAQRGIAVLVACAAALLLQVLVAPYIAVHAVFPNFVAVAVLLLAVTRPRTFGPVAPFAMGLLFDLLSGGPIGPMALVLLVFGLLAARFFEAADNDTAFMPLLVMVAALFLVEAAYGLLLLLFGYNAGLGAMLVWRILPCFVYDCVFACLLLPLARRLLAEGQPLQADITRLR